MNRRKYTRVMSGLLLTGVCITSFGFTSNAAMPVAGASARILDAEIKAVSTPNNDKAEVFSGVNAVMAKVLVDNSPAETAASTSGVTVSVEDIAPANPYENIGIAQVGDYVNIRSEANEESEPVGKLYSNGAATILGQEGDWYHISSGSVEGYIKGEFLSVGDKDICESASKVMATVHAETLYVRADSSTESEVLDMLADESKIEVASDSPEDGDWVKVKSNAGDGYVAKEYVDIEREYSYAESKAEEEARIAREEAAAKAKAKQSGSSNGSSGSYAPPASSSGAAVANFALQFVGNPYVYGGSSLTNGTDCSGFVMAVYSQFGVGLPHSSGADRSVGYGVDVSQMAPGDIVCYNGHVGIAIGGGQIVHASTPSTGIKVSNAFYKNIVAVRRIF